MKSPQRVGAAAAPKRPFPSRSGPPRSGKARRIASLSAAAAMVVGIGAASAIFVDYLADRALARTADAPAPVVAKSALPADAAETGTPGAAAAIAPEAPAPVKPAETRIAAAMPDAAAIAKVAIGPEHAVELPADDPTASPILQLDEVAAQDDASLVDEAVPDEEPIAAYAEEADGTQTAAIDRESALDGQPVKRSERRKAEKAKPRAVGRQTEVASLPGVDIGGLAGNPSGDDNSVSTVRTVTKPAKAAVNGGGVAAGPARVTAAVNLRTSPGKASSIAAVVPDGSSVDVLSCDGWCQVVYNGKKGWVYRSFLASSRPGSEPKRAADPAPADQPAETATRKIKSHRL